MARIEPNISVLLQHDEGWLCFHNPVQIIRALRIAEVLPSLQRIEKDLQAGFHAAGFLSYEASCAFDPALKTHRPGDFPLLWFGIFQPPRRLTTLPESDDPFQISDWRLNISEREYAQNIHRIKAWLASGDTCQVNYTVRMHADYSGDPYIQFKQIVQAQHTQHAAFVRTADFTVCSASPELFFRLDRNMLVSRPMKGTAPRGKILSEDEAIREFLCNSEKERAENVMITDMMRNDMGRIALPGSVHVPKLFEAEKYPTVWQLTSTVASKTNAGITDIFSALFPCASITGAPKPRTMEIICELETSPRKIYTGAIGHIGPDRTAQFNVAIRTALFDHTSGKAEYGVGGGIVWDSQPESEYRECQIKARVLTRKQPEFDLIEGLLWRPETGYFILDYHLKRLMDSVRYFDFKLDWDTVRKHLERAVPRYPNAPQKVRLIASKDGTIQIEWEPVSRGETPLPVKVALADDPIHSEDIFLYHKTTARSVYDQARSRHPEADDVILFNARDEITEACTSNVVISNGDEFLTPPVTCGLLGGTFRAYLLDQGEIRERVITKSDLLNAERIFLTNAVRKWREARWIQRLKS